LEKNRLDFLQTLSANTFGFHFSANFFRQHHLKTDFVFNYFFKKPGTENEFELTTKVATEMQTWKIWVNVSRLCDCCDANELRTFS
jgi:hypothetical protein